MRYLQSHVDSYEESKIEPNCAQIIEILLFENFGQFWKIERCWMGWF